MKDGKKVKSEGLFLLGKVAILATMLVLLFVFVFGCLCVKDNNMYPRISEGDLLLFYRIPSQYVAGDVVVYKNGDTPCIARIVAIEGDVVNVTEDGQVIVNGALTSSDGFYPCYIDKDAAITYPYEVNAGEYFLLSDYCAEIGGDSRTIGAVNQNRIDGKAFTVIRRRGF